MRLLLGVADFGEQEEKILCQFAEESGILISDCDRRYTKAGIFQYLDRQPDTDVVVFSEAVEGGNPFVADDYELLAEKHERVKMIPVLMDERQGTEYVRDIFYSGIYNAVFASDADTSTVLHLMNTGRSRKEAKLYYKLDNIDELDKGADIDRCVRRICKTNDRQELTECVKHMHNMLNAEEFREVLSKLDSRRLEDLRNIPDIAALIPDIERNDNVSGVKSGILSSIAGAVADVCRTEKSDLMESEKIRQPDPVNSNLHMNALSVDDLYDIISNVIVGFVGNQRRSGVTHQAITAAHFLAAHGYHVALADCSARGGKSLSAFETIEKYRDTSVLSTDSFSYLGVDYYKNMNVDALNDIFLVEKKYHFVIVDYGTFSPYVKADIGRCTIKCAVCGSMPWEVNQLRAFVNDTRFLSDQMIYLIRGVASDARHKQEWISELVENYLFADIQEDPFDGTCYPALAGLFDKYVKGLPVRSEGVRKRKKNQTTEQKLADMSNKKELTQDRPLVKRGLFHKREMDCKKNAVHSGKESDAVRSIAKKTVGGCWFVTGLKHGVGISYTAAIIANILAAQTDKVCLITNDAYLQEYVSGKVSLCMWEGVIDSVFSTSNVVVLDGGVYSELSADRKREMARASHKYMVCRSNDGYMHALANYLAGDETEGNGWAYIFNQIPPADHGKVKRLMSSYDICFTPLCDAGCLSKDVQRGLSGILV